MDYDAPTRLRRLPSWRLNQAALPAQRIIADRLATAGARRQHYALLASLDEFGPASQAALGRRTWMDRSDVVAVINELADGGFVERAPDPTDRRRNVITLTRAGTRHLRRLDTLLADAEDELLGPLSVKEREQLMRLLSRIGDHHAAQAGAGGPWRSRAGRP